METSLIVMFIILAIESIALTFLYVKFHQEKRKTSLRIERNNENLVERSNYYIKQKIEEALSNRKEESKSTLMFELKGLKELTPQDLLTRIKSLEKYLDLSFKSESDGCIVNWYHEPNENNSDELKSAGCLNNDFYELNKEIDKIEARLKILVARKAMEDMAKLLKRIKE